MGKKPRQPLPNAEFQILLALLPGPIHGHGIKKDVQARTGGSVVLGPGTLYTAIKRMLLGRLIEEAEPPDPDEDQRRRYYRITLHGRSVAVAEARRMRRLLETAAERELIAEPWS